MSTLGEKLRKEREARGVSLKELASQTCINEKFLRAIEEDRYSEIQGDVFTIGFLRAYSKHLGLDGDKIIAEYEIVKTERPTDVKRPPSVEIESDSSFSVVGIIGFLVFLLIGYVVYINMAAEKKAELRAPVVTKEKRFEEKTPEPSAPIPVPLVSEGEVGEVDAETPAETPVPMGEDVSIPALDESVPPEPVTPKKAEVPAATGPRPAPPEEVEAEGEEEIASAESPATSKPASHKYTLGVMAVGEDVWILVVVDGATIRDMFVRAGHRIYLRGNESFRFTTGNAAHVKVTLNGKDVPLKVPPSNVIRNMDIPLE